MSELTLKNTLTNYELEQSYCINEELLKEFIKELQVSENSKQTYLENVKHFLKWVEGKPINKTTLLDYKQHLIANYKASAVNSYISAIKQLFIFLEQYGFTNISKGIKGLKLNKKLHKREALTIEQVKNIFNSIDTSTLTGARDYALIKLLIGSGLRQCEVVNANVGSIQTMGDKKVIFIQGKGYNNAKENISDYVILTPSVLNALQGYLKYRPSAKDNEPLFTSMSDRNNGERLTTRSIREIVKRIYKQNGIVSERITTHSTRHTAITLSLVGGATLQEAQALARHSNINTTMIYAHNLDRLSNNAESKLETLLSE